MDWSEFYNILQNYASNYIDISQLKSKTFKLPIEGKEFLESLSTQLDSLLSEEKSLKTNISRVIHQEIEKYINEK